MDVVIVAEFCGDFSRNDNVRFLYIARMLSGMAGGASLNGGDIDVEIVTSSFHHATKRHRRRPVAQWPFKITFIEEPGYPRNVCLRRFQSHFIWGRSAFEYIKSREKKPDVIYCAVPSLTGPNLIAKYCEREGIRFIIDVQDLWPEAFQMVLDIPVVSSIIFMPFRMLANGIYKRADSICAVSDTYCRRAKRANRKVSHTTTVYLGTELATFDRNAAGKPIIEKKEGEVWLAYCGTLGSSYDLKVVIDALAIVSDSRVRFIVMGDGPQKNEFKAYAEEKDVKAMFVGMVRYDEMCSLLSECDIAVNPIVHMAAQSIINKHADYAAAGLPVLNTQESEEYRKLVENYQMGFNCKNGDSNELARKLVALVNDEVLRRKMGSNARKCAEERFDRAKTYKLLEKEFL